MHSITEADERSLTGICAECGPVGVRRKKCVSSTLGWRWQCREKLRAEKLKARPPSTRVVKGKFRDGLGPVCERCGFVPEDRCQLEADHIVARWRGGTDEPENRQTLCANCHALKTKQDRLDWRAAHP